MVNSANRSQRCSVSFESTEQGKCAVSTWSSANKSSVHAVEEAFRGRLYEGWVIKQSRWIGQWRRRWLVLTSSKLMCFEVQQHGQQRKADTPTAAYAVKELRGARVLEAHEVPQLIAAGPLNCIVAPDRPPALDGLVALHLRGEARPLLLAANPDGNAAEKRLAAAELTTALVNAGCAIRAKRRQYLVPGAVHAFEPRGVVTLRDRYRVGEALHHGTFGTTFRGCCLQTGRAVAIKKVRLLEQPHMSASAARNAVRYEVTILREISSPHVVALLDHTTDGAGVACLVTELLPTGTLYAQLLQRCYQRASAGLQVGYSEADISAILHMALTGLAAIHDLSVAHRNIEPQTVMLIDRQDGVLDVRITGFGAAQRLPGGGGSTKGTIGAVGARGYTAPEVLSGLEYGIAADVWSLGVICFTLLCGQHPFVQKDAVREDACLREGQWSFEHCHWNEISVEAKDSVRRLLERVPHKRTTAQEALDLPWYRLQSADVGRLPTSPEEVGAQPAGIVMSTPRGASFPGSGPRTIPLAACQSLLHLERHDSVDWGVEWGALSTVDLQPDEPGQWYGNPPSVLPGATLLAGADLDLMDGSASQVAAQDSIEEAKAPMARSDSASAVGGGGSIHVAATPTTADMLSACASDGHDQHLSSSFSRRLRSRTDEHGHRIRIFTATVACDRAVKAGAATFRYDGETIVVDERTGASEKMERLGGMPGKLRHGHGKIVYECGNTYVGQWQHDKRCGEGRLEYACGDVYEGEWRDGMYHGRGSYSSTDKGGDEYVGEWRQDKPHGYGRYYDSATKEMYEGEWINGMREGKGKVVRANGEVIEGQYECGERLSIALDNAAFAAGIDECGDRIRMFTASLTCERAMKANLASCVYEGYDRRC